jgi:hypothetical protein
MITLIIKGTALQAENYVRLRGLRMEGEPEYNGQQSKVKVEEDLSSFKKIYEWMWNIPYRSTPPYSAGTLLWYGGVSLEHPKGWMARIDKKREKNA